MGAVLDKTALTDDAKPAIISSIEEGRYAHVLIMLAKHFCESADVTIVKIIDLGEAGMRLRLWDSKDNVAERDVSFVDAEGNTPTATTAEELRRILVGMARIAANATGDELALPPSVTIDYRESAKVPGAYCLNQLIDISNVECLNQDDEHPLTNLIGEAAEVDGSTDAALQSDTDEQLLIKFRFVQKVKLRAISFRGNVEDQTAPESIGIFKDKMDLNFADVEDSQATQTLTLSAEQVKTGDPVQLSYVKFQDLTTLQLFVRSNFGAEVTRIEQLELWGVLADTMDMKDWKPLKGDVSNPVRPIVEPVSDAPI